MLQKNNVKSFNLLDQTTDRKYHFSFINDSVIILAKTDTQYVLRDNLVLPILNEEDSLEYYNFWKDKTIKKYDSVNVQITKYYEQKDDTDELIFKTYVYQDSIVNYSYDFFKYKHTSIATVLNDTTITVNHWVDDFGNSIVIDKYIRKNYVEGTNTITRVYYSKKKENSDEAIETKEYIFTIKKKKRAIEKIFFETKESGVVNYSIEKIKYGRN
jgi:replicative DNA helicase